jgi:hypothetical protein
MAVFAAIAFAVLVILATTAAAASSTTIIDVPSAKRAGADQMTFTEPTNAEGETCDVWLQETNEPQPSAHPGNQLVLSTGGNVVGVMDIERTRGGSNGVPFNDVVIGDTMTLEWVNGPDGVSSAGAWVSIDCEQETPSTTTTSSTTLVPPSTTQPTTVPSTTTTSIPICEVSECDLTCENFPEDERLDCPVPVPTTTVSTTVPDTTSTTLPAPSTTDTTPIPSGVPTGEGPPPNSPVLPLMVAALAVSAIGVGAYRVSRRGDDE